MIKADVRPGIKQKFQSPQFLLWATNTQGVVKVLSPKQWETQQTQLSKAQVVKMETSFQSLTALVLS